MIRAEWTNNDALSAEQTTQTNDSNTLNALGWIPVTERLPEDGQNVLVTVEGWYKGNMFERDVDLATYSPCGGYIDGFDTVNDWIEYGEWKATAWMPLPEPYKEATDAQLD